MSATLELLRPLPLFTALTADELGKIAELCVSKSFESGEYIFREGEAGNRLFIIVEGGVRISREIPGAGEEALAVLKCGSMFGEMAVFDRSERSTDAISHGGTTVLTIPPPGFRRPPGFNGVPGARASGGSGPREGR